MDFNREECAQCTFLCFTSQPDEASSSCSAMQGRLGPAENRERNQSPYCYIFHLSVEIACRYAVVGAIKIQAFRSQPNF